MSNLSISAPAVPTEHHVPQNHKPPPQNPKSLSAEEHHRHLLKCYRLGNRVRREFIEALLFVNEQRLYLKLGSPSIQHYAEKYFRYEPALTYESLRVARVLRQLPLSSGAFDRGEVSWSALREIPE